MTIKFTTKNLYGINNVYMADIRLRDFPENTRMLNFSLTLKGIQPMHKLAAGSNVKVMIDFSKVVMHLLSLGQTTELL
jgi:hypothetical protein